MRFCSSFGAPVVLETPEGDDIARHVCTSCRGIHYRNPVVVAGCIPFWQGQVFLLSVTNVIKANQVHLFYQAEMLTADFHAGRESLEVRLFHPKDIPWHEIAFDSVEETLRQPVGNVLGFPQVMAPLQRCSMRPPRASHYDATDDVPIPSHNR